MPEHTTKLLCWACTYPACLLHEKACWVTLVKAGSCRALLQLPKGKRGLHGARWEEHALPGAERTLYFTTHAWVRAEGAVPCHVIGDHVAYSPYNPDPTCAFSVHDSQASLPFFTVNMTHKGYMKIATIA